MCTNDFSHLIVCLIARGPPPLKPRSLYASDGSDRVDSAGIAQKALNWRQHEAMRIAGSAGSFAGESSLRKAVSRRVIPYR